jgi:bacteriocin-like protein
MWLVRLRGSTGEIHHFASASTASVIRSTATSGTHIPRSSSSFENGMSRAWARSAEKDHEQDHGAQFQSQRGVRERRDELSEDELKKVSGGYIGETEKSVWRRS